jgi:hypothetical protein
MAAGPHADFLTPFTRLQEVCDLVRWLQDRVLTVSPITPPQRVRDIIRWL